MKKVEAELQKGQKIAKESLEQADAQLDQLNSQAPIVISGNGLGADEQELVQNENEKVYLSKEELLAQIESKGFSHLQKTLEVNKVMQ